MYVTKESELFITDLESLPNKSLQKQVLSAVRLLEQSPSHPSLKSHQVSSSPKGRTIWESYVNTRGWRLLWEYLEDGAIALWRIVDHDHIDDAAKLPEIVMAAFRGRGKSQEERAAAGDAAQPLFRGFKDNHLRLLGVPDDCIESVLGLCDEEALWDLPLPELVKWTLFDVLTKPEAWSEKGLFDPRFLRYRATVDQLEGYTEGRIKRLLLNLTDEQKQVVEIKASGPLLVKGTAGSGKTTIGIYRAQRAAEEADLFETPRVLILTFTRALTRGLCDLFTELYGDKPANVEFGAIYDWIAEQAGLFMGTKLKMVPSDQRTRFIVPIQSELRKRLGLDRLPFYLKNKYLLAEIDYILGRGITTLKDYLQIKRVGRRLALREEARRLVWEAFQYYRDCVQKEGMFDYAELPSFMLYLKQDRNFEAYHTVIIDEAQDLSPMALKVARRLVKNGSGEGLVLLADPAQSIYYRGIPWSEGDVGIKGGRTRVLTKNFRNTRQVLEAARGVIEKCLSLQEANEYIPPESTSRPGPKPIVTACETDQVEATEIAEQILRLCQRGLFRPGDFAVLALQKDRLKQIRKVLIDHDIPCEYFRSDEFAILENHVKLVTMHSAKGLEFPVVMLASVNDGILPQLSDVRNEDEEEIEKQRKLLYVSMTRAAERLFIYYRDREPSRFLRDMDPATYVKQKAYAHPAGLRH